MERRNFIRLSVMGAGALGAAQHVLAQPTAAESLATLKNIYFTQQSPGRWKGKEATHLPVITVTPEGANCHVNVVTPHEMKGLEHYIVKHVLLDKNYEVLAIPSPKFKPLLHESYRFLRLGRYDHQLKTCHHFCPVH